LYYSIEKRIVEIRYQNEPIALDAIIHGYVKFLNAAYSITTGRCATVYDASGIIFLNCMKALGGFVSYIGSRNIRAYTKGSSSYRSRVLDLRAKRPTPATSDFCREFGFKKFVDVAVDNQNYPVAYNK
jgi:hypothetical protein